MARAYKPPSEPNPFPSSKANKNAKKNRPVNTLIPPPFNILRFLAVSRSESFGSAGVGFFESGESAKRAERSRSRARAKVGDQRQEREIGRSNGCGVGWLYVMLCYESNSLKSIDRRTGQNSSPSSCVFRPLCVRIQKRSLTLCHYREVGWMAISGPDPPIYVEERAYDDEEAKAG